jgi:hypothetical protein
VSTETKSRPTHRIFAVTKNGKKKFWQPIGAVWAHGGRKGFNQTLDYLPLNNAETVVRELATTPRPRPTGTRSSVPPSALRRSGPSTLRDVRPTVRRPSGRGNLAETPIPTSCLRTLIQPTCRMRPRPTGGRRACNPRVGSPTCSKCCRNDLVVRLPVAPECIPLRSRLISGCQNTGAARGIRTPDPIITKDVTQI